MAGSSNRDRAFILRHRFRIVGGFLIAVTVIAAGLSIWDRRQQTEASYRREVTNLSVTLAEQTARSMQAVDLVLQEIQSKVTAAAINSPGELDAQMSGADTHRFLADRLAALPQAQGISVIDAKGLMIGSSREWPARLDVSDRDYFVFLRDHNNTDVFISTPARSRVTNHWAFFLARRINGRHGEFLGLMLGVIDVGYFEELYKGITLPEGGSVAIFRADGTMLLRHPRLVEMIGRKLPARSEWYWNVAQGGGTYRTMGNVDGTVRIASVRPIRDYPLVISVTVPERTALTSWRHFALLVSLGAIFLIFCFGFLFAMLARNARKLERQAVALTASAEAVKGSESRFRDFALTSSDWFWETDRDHRITYVSEGIRAFGQDPDRFIGRSRIDNAAPSDRSDEKWEAHLAALERHEPFRDFVFTVRFEDRRELTISSCGAPVFDGRGEFLGYRGTARDITAIKAAEAHLRSVIEHLDRVQRIAGVASIAVDFKSKRIIWSSQSCALFGIDSQITESTQEFMLELVHPDDRAAVYDAAQKTNLTGTVAPPLEYRIVRPDGTERFVYRENAIEADDNGVPVRRVVTYQDITDYKRTEARLREAMSNLEGAQQLAHTGSDVWDLRTGAVTWSAEVYRIFGVDSATFVPTPLTLYDLVVPEDRSILATRREEILQGKCPAPTEFSVRRPDGETRRIYSEGEIVFDSAGRPLRWVGTRQDITEQRRIERNLREAKDAAEAANLAKSQFLANMSHELRTPLNAIIGFSELLELGISGPLLPRQREYAGLIRQSGDHLHTVINDILDLAKVDAGKLELREEVGIDPTQIIDACVQLVTARAKEGGITLSVKTSEQLPLVVADSTRLKQILLNLLSNAVKFTEPGGLVTLSVRRTKTGGLAFEVRDTGPGMTAAEIEIAFEPFGQTDAGLARRHEGTGLGLPLARRLAVLHGGSLRLDSTKGRGTSVILSLPPERVMKQPRRRASSKVAA